ncbi:MAG: Crp/Fnr family transcriptional regulator [Erythrobacter sp.]|nr:Crp/Fnr family transcriptional regulator [Erythrobacter sp.]
MNADDRQFTQRAIATSSVLGLLTPVLQERLLRSAQVIRCKGATLLCSAEEQPSQLYLVLHGQIELTARTADGEEMTISALGPGSWITWLGLFDNRPALHDIVAAPGSRIVAVPAKLIRDAAASVPECYPAIIAEIGGRFRALIQWVEQSALVGRDRRLAQLLLSLARSSGTGTNDVLLTRAKIARLMGCSRQTLHDALRSLEASGLIKLAYGRIAIVDQARLEQRA